MSWWGQAYREGVECFAASATRPKRGRLVQANKCQMAAHRIQELDMWLIQIQTWNRCIASTALCGPKQVTRPAQVSEVGKHISLFMGKPAKSPRKLCACGQGEGLWLFLQTFHHSDPEICSPKAPVFRQMGGVRVRVGDRGDFLPSGAFPFPDTFRMGTLVLSRTALMTEK